MCHKELLGGRRAKAPLPPSSQLSTESFGCIVEQLK